MVVWPIKGGRPRKVGGFGARRPADRSEPAERHHVGVDIRTPEGSVIVATEAGILARVQGWRKGSKALLVWTDSGRTIVVGPILPNSWKAAGLSIGDRVSQGQPIGVTTPYPKGDEMLHFETYRGHHKRNIQWKWDTAQPLDIVDPATYLQDAGQPVTGPAVAHLTKKTRKITAGGGSLLPILALAIAAVSLRR